MAVTPVWVEFPEINRKLAFQTSYSPFTSGLGCQCSSIANIAVCVGASYSRDGESFSSYSIIKPQGNDKKIKSQAAPPHHSYYGYYIPHEDEEKLLNDYLAENKLNLDAIRDKSFGSIVDSCLSIPLWVLSDVVNYRSPSRNGGQAPTNKVEFINPLGVKRGNVAKWVQKTCNFADYLIQNKVGYVMESPLVQNPAHRGWGNYSINKAWIWIPPSQTSRSLDSAKEYGKDKLCSYKNWTETISKDFIEVDSFKKLGFESALFDDGIIPDERRFNRSI